VEAPSVNGFGYTYPLLERIVGSAYMGVIRRTPKVWDYLYDNPKVFKRSQPIKRFLHKTSHKKIGKLLERYQPDTIVCTQAFPCGMVADYKMANNLPIKLIGVLTDYAPHSYWINEGVDYYVVPDEEVKDRLVKKGVAPELVKVLGIPVRSKFAVPLNKEEIAKKLGIDLNIPVILMMGGGQGLGPIKETVVSLNDISMPLQMIVITGVNKKLTKWLHKAGRKLTKKILTFPYVSNVEELMEVATLIVTKPGGMTTSECLAKGLPMVIINPIPGQEMRNAEFLVRSGVGVLLGDTSNIGEEVELLLKSPERLSAMRQAALKNSKPYAAVNIAKLILGQLTND
jgi:processive 1,2-diacylglycerol beta-glucosyltransferase